MLKSKAANVGIPKNMTTALIKRLNASCNKRYGVWCLDPSGCLGVGWCDEVWQDVLATYQGDMIRGKLGHEGARHGSAKGKDQTRT